MLSLFTHLIANRYKLRYVCSAETAVDPMFQWMGDDLEKFCKDNQIALYWRDAKPNLGANANAAIRLCNAPIIMFQQDDWYLKEDLDISPGADFLLANREIDLLRYSFPDNDRMRPIFHPRSDGWNEVDKRSTWFYGDDPHLRRQDFMRKWGWYLEGGKHASASGALMKKLKVGNARIVASSKCYYQHFGKTSSYSRHIEFREGRRR